MVIGGHNGISVVNDVYEINFMKLEIRKYAALKCKRYFMVNQAIKLDNLVYVFGGHSSEDYVYSVECIDLIECTTNITDIGWRHIYPGFFFDMPMITAQI